MLLEIFIYSLIILFIIFVLYHYLKIKENFTLPNFMQIMPKYGESPLITTFTPTIKDLYTPFIVDFGDGTTFEGNDNNIFSHLYKKKGKYCGKVIYSENGEPHVEQKFIVQTY